MALPSSGAVSFGNINSELQNPSTQQISLNDTTVRDMFSISSGAIDMNTGHGKGIVTSGMILHLDASNTSSYNGTGTWYDISGAGNNFSIQGSNSHTAPTGNLANGYLAFDGSSTWLQGPAGNSMSISQDFTIEAFVTPTNAKVNMFISWNGIESGDSRAILSHLPWADGNCYFDVAGCCGPSQRVNFYLSQLNTTFQIVYRCRTTATPYRQVLINTVSQVDSGTNGTNTLNFTSDNCAIGNYYAGGYNWQGNLYYFRMYNRGLSDAEIAQNFQASRGRFGI